MPQKSMLTLSDIAKKINAGKATIKFILKRFDKWLPSELIDGIAHYSNSCIKNIIFIQTNLDEGMLTADIEKQLPTLEDNDPHGSASDDLIDTFVKSSQNGDIRLSNDGIFLLKSLISDIGDQQKRIAKAHEKRAEAEERKAVAIEKRAGAEEQKAVAMNNIAIALQEMNQLRTSDPETMQIANDAVSVIAIDNDENDEFQDNIKSLNDENQNINQDIKQDIKPDNQENSEADPNLDDLSLLIEDEQKDDLSLLLDDKIEPENIEPENIKLDDLSSLIDIQQPDQKLDDLSALIDTTAAIKQPDLNLDDLSKLIDENADSTSKPVQLDDLSQLIDSTSSDSQKTKSKQKAGEIDDLSKLINEQPNQSQSDTKIDDLKQLLDDDSTDKGKSDQKLDNLASLIDDEPAKTDDLSKLIEKQPEIEPEIKIDISPKEDIGKYKTAVMKIIIGLKNDGLDEKETTSRLNSNKIKTLSGKSEWSQQAISQIYKFIDSAK